MREQKKQKKCRRRPKITLVEIIIKNELLIKKITESMNSHIKKKKKIESMNSYRIEWRKICSQPKNLGLRLVVVVSLNHSSMNLLLFFIKFVSLLLFIINVLAL